MKILGIDPGLHIIGYGLIELFRGKEKLIEAGVIRTNKKKNIENKLQIIYTELHEIIKQHSPDSIAVEDLFSIYKHPRPAILMGHARGVIFLTASQNNINVMSYTPTKVKKFLTGNGHASKQQMQRMIQNVLNLKELPKPPDVADALAISLCHANHLKRKR